MGIGWGSGGHMRKIFAAIVFLGVAAQLAGCGYTPQQRATSGAALGGATGAAIGATTGGGVGAALAGGVLGAATGAIIGANTAPPPPPVYYPPPPPRCARWGHDVYGNAYCIEYYGY